MRGDVLIVAFRRENEFHLYMWAEGREFELQQLIAEQTMRDDPPISEKEAACLVGEIQRRTSRS